MVPPQLPPARFGSCGRAGRTFSRRPATRASPALSRQPLRFGRDERRNKAHAGPPRPKLLVDADGRTVRFADGGTLDVAVVVWATGYRSDYSWNKVPGVVRDGRLAHRRGVTDIAGLYLLGLSWQHTRGSALLGFVNDDAAYLAVRIAAHQHATTPVKVPGARLPLG